MDEIDIQKDFWSHIEKTDFCWLWKGNKNFKGYGQLPRHLSRKRYMAHRISYEIHKGYIPNGMFVCHNCDFVDICPPMDEDEYNYGCIVYPDKNNPELTKELFFEIMCYALPLSNHPNTSFHIEVDLGDVDKKLHAMHLTDSYSPGQSNHYNGDFWYNGKAFSQDLENKLNEIRRIVNR